MTSDFSFFTEPAGEQRSNSKWRWRQGDTVSAAAFESLLEAIEDARKNGFRDSRDSMALRTLGVSQEPKTG